MDELKILVQREVKNSGIGLPYASLLTTVMREQPEKRKRLPQALRDLQNEGVLHEVVQRNEKFGQIEYLIMAGERPEPTPPDNAAVSDG